MSAAEVTADAEPPDRDQVLRDRRVARNLAELGSLTEQLRQVPKWNERRTKLLLALRDDGVPYAVIADHYDGRAEAARVAVNKARRARAGEPVTRKRRKTSTRKS